MSCSLSVIFIKHTNLPKLTCGLKILHERAAPNLCLFIIMPCTCFRTNGKKKKKQ